MFYVYWGLSGPEARYWLGSLEENIFYSLSSFHLSILKTIHNATHYSIHDAMHDAMHDAIHDAMQDAIHDAIHNVLQAYGMLL